MRCFCTCDAFHISNSIIDISEQVCDKVVERLPRETEVAKCTSATRNEGECRQVPRLHATHRVEGYICKTKVDAPTTQNEGRSACHAKGRWMRSNVTPTMRNKHAIRLVQCRWCVTKFCEKWLSERYCV